mgnify:CR=1 FL=1
MYVYHYHHHHLHHHHQQQQQQQQLSEGSDNRDGSVSKIRGSTTPEVLKNTKKLERTSAAPHHRPGRRLNTAYSVSANGPSGWIRTTHVLLSVRENYVCLMIIKLCSNPTSHQIRVVVLYPTLLFN